jgi:hypothetical protein
MALKTHKDRYESTAYCQSYQGSEKVGIEY